MIADDGSCVFSAGGVVKLRAHLNDMYMAELSGSVACPSETIHADPILQNEGRSESPDLEEEVLDPRL